MVGGYRIGGGQAGKNQETCMSLSMVDSRMCFCMETRPKQIKEIKEFIDITRRADAKSIKIKKNKDKTKFKARTSKYLYTLVLSNKDQDKIVKLRKTLPPSVDVVELK